MENAIEDIYPEYNWIIARSMDDAKRIANALKLFYLVDVKEIFPESVAPDARRDALQAWSEANKAVPTLVSVTDMATFTRETFDELCTGIFASKTAFLAQVGAIQTAVDYDEFRLLRNRAHSNGPYNVNDPNVPIG